MEERIRKAVEAALAELGAGDVRFLVERPADRSHGDYAVNAAMAAAKPLGKNPRDIAAELAEKLTPLLGGDAEKIEVAGAGFVNVTLSRNAISSVVKNAQEKAWGQGKENDGARVMVEYTDPNPFKEMHIGHLMSNTIGEAVSRLTAASGAHVVRANYQGDVGPHVAKAIWALRKAGNLTPNSAVEIAKAYTHGSRAYEESAEAKEEIDALNVAIYRGEDAELMDLWRLGRQVSLDAFERIYAALGTKFDYYFFESEVAKEGMEVVKDGVTRGVFEESEGAVVYKGEKKGLHTLVFITSRGTPTYEAKEIGLAFEKEERWPSSLSLILTAAEQIGHFKVVKAALEDIAPALGAKTMHIPHGFLRLTTGKMSSREGNVITAAELLDDVRKLAEEKNPDPVIAEQVAIGAVKYMVLRQAAGQDIIFDPEKSLSLEGDSGPYLQYALVRAKKLLTYANESSGDAVPDAPYVIERLIIYFPEVVARAAKEHAPQLLTHYLTELAAEWNAFYATQQVLGSPEEAYKQNVARAFANTMTRGLSLLGIPTPDKM
jgi:arginyl-tRNA synthetase